MADLPDNSFVKINDVETAQQAPMSEALAQKYGTNENTLDAESTVDQSNIATNTTDIATNAAAIATGVPEFFTTENLQLTGAFQTIHTFSGAPTNVLIQFTQASAVSSGVVIVNDTIGTASVVVGAITVTFAISGSNIQAKASGGSPLSTDDFIGMGWV